MLLATADWLEWGVAAAGEALQIKTKTQMEWIWRILEHFSLLLGEAEEQKKIYERTETLKLGDCMYEKWWNWEHVKDLETKQSFMWDFPCYLKRNITKFLFIFLQKRKRLKLVIQVLHFKKVHTLLKIMDFQWDAETFTAALQQIVATRRGLRGRGRISFTNGGNFAIMQKQRLCSVSEGDLTHPADSSGMLIPDTHLSLLSIPATYYFVGQCFLHQVFFNRFACCNGNGYKRGPEALLSDSVP